MATGKAKKRWIKAAVLTIGVADCVGLYYAQHRLNQPVPDAIRYDRTAIMVPEENSMFRAGDAPQFARAEPVASPVAVPARAEPAPAPHMAKAEPAAVAAPQPVAPKLAAAPAPRAIVTPHLARIEPVAAGYHAAPAQPAKPALTSAKQTAGLTLVAKAEKVAKSEKTAAPAKQAVTKVAKSAHHATSLARLVPQQRDRSEFSSAFAGFDAPVDQARQLELALPTIEPLRVASPAADFAASSPMLETPIPVAPAELPPVTASADAPEAKL